jgi:predicted phosphodiesterase
LPGFRHGPLARGVTIALVALAAAFGGLAAVWGLSVERRLSAGTISLSTSPFHHPALDLYVPLVDWGARFPGGHLPARLRVEVQAIDRAEAVGIARGGIAATEPLRAEARDAVASYLKLLALAAGGAALALGALSAAALAQLHLVRVRWLMGTATLVAVAWALAIGLLLAPRGVLSNPSYYAHGRDIPVALQALEAAGRTPERLSASLGSQLVGLARLVVAPGRRPDLSGRPRLTIASDMHNNVLLVPTLRSAAAGGPILFLGDLTDRGTPLETDVLRRVVATGHPFVFTPGNHDSDTLARALTRAGAIVLTQRGRLLADGRYGPLVAHVEGLRIAGYASPNERRVADGYRDRGAAITPAQQRAFADWIERLRGRVDVVLAHEPELVALALRRLRTDPTSPALLVVGHTHEPAVDSADGVTEVNGGTLGAGGLGNLDEQQDASLAILTYARSPFRPLAVDLVTLDPGTGETTARRVRLGAGGVQTGGAR